MDFVIKYHLFFCQRFLWMSVLVLTMWLPFCDFPFLLSFSELCSDLGHVRMCNHGRLKSTDSKGFAPTWEISVCFVKRLSTMKPQTITIHDFLLWIETIWQTADYYIYLVCVWQLFSKRFIFHMHAVDICMFSFSFFFVIFHQKK